MLYNTFVKQPLIILHYWLQLKHLISLFSLIMCGLQNVFDRIRSDQEIYCNCIVTRGGAYNEILPEPEGNPEGSGNISSYTPTQVRIQSFSITFTTQYFLVLTP